MSNKAIMNGVNVLLEKLEKKDKLLELYKELSNLYEELDSIDLTLYSDYYEITNEKRLRIEINKIKQQIKELEK